MLKKFFLILKIHSFLAKNCMALNRFIILQKNSLNEHSFIEGTLKILVLLSAVLVDHRYRFRLTSKM